MDMVMLNVSFETLCRLWQTSRELHYVVRPHWHADCSIHDIGRLTVILVQSFASLQQQNCVSELCSETVRLVKASSVKPQMLILPEKRLDLLLMQNLIVHGNGAKPKPREISIDIC